MKKFNTKYAQILIKANKILSLCASIIILFSPPVNLYAEILTGDEFKSISINIDQYIDLADLEYDDSPYPGRTNLGHIFIPNIQINTIPITLNLGGWYKHVYVQYNEDTSPARMYPYMNAMFFPWINSEFIIGNYPNLAELPNTIYNEFLFFEQRPISSGLKFRLNKKTIDLSTYIDWIKLDTKEHPEEFITGLILKHNLAEYLYYNFFTHYHHKGGQLHKDTHPVRIEQDIVTSPALGLNYKGFYAELEYYLNTFSQNFQASTYGHAYSGSLGYDAGMFDVSYQCFYNRNYYHQDAHIFYLKRENIFNRLRFDCNIFKYKEIVDVMFTINLYGIDPPGIDFRLFAKVNLNILEYSNTRVYQREEESFKNKEIEQI